MLLKIFQRYIVLTIYFIERLNSQYISTLQTISSIQGTIFLLACLSVTIDGAGCPRSPVAVSQCEAPCLTDGHNGDGGCAEARTRSSASTIQCIVRTRDTSQHRAATGDWSMGQDQVFTSYMQAY